MPSIHWMKLYNEILDDPKMMTLSDRLFRRVIECFLLANDHDEGGELPRIDKMAWRLRADPGTLQMELRQIEEKTGIIQCEDGIWFVPNFTKRQGPMSNAERARLWRDRKYG